MIVIETPTWLAFAGAALVILLLPGPGVLYVVARSVGQGYAAGLISAVGLSVGVFAHVAAAVAGLTAVLLTSATAFEFVKLAGASYLVYLGVRTILTKTSTDSLTMTNHNSLARVFSDGVVVSILNPKIAIFFIAFLPQFVDPDRGAPHLQILLLGTAYAGLALITDSAYALLAGRVRALFGRAFSRGPWFRYASGGVLIGLGAHAALTGVETRLKR